MFNRLQTAAETVAPWLHQVQQQFRRLDLLGHQLSGSGSAYFGLCRNAGHARRVAAVLRSRCAGHVFCAGTVKGRLHRVLPASQY
jgi:4-diphosphocytidyl-2-C-methyl-D-erythritol kinase